MKPKDITELNKERRKRILNASTYKVECKNIEDITEEGKKELLAALFNAVDSGETVESILDTVAIYGEALCGDPDISLSAGMNRVTGACEILGTLIPSLREDLLKVLAKAASDFACNK